MCRGREVKKPKDCLGNNETGICLGVMVCIWHIVDYEFRNIDVNSTVESSEYQIKEIIALFNVISSVKTWSS